MFKMWPIVIWSCLETKFRIVSRSVIDKAKIPLTQGAVVMQSGQSQALLQQRYVSVVSLEIELKCH